MNTIGIITGVLLVMGCVAALGWMLFEAITDREERDAPRRSDKMRTHYDEFLEKRRAK